MATKEMTTDEAVAAAEADLPDEFEEDFTDEVVAAPASEPTETAANSGVASPWHGDDLDREVPADKLTGYFKNKAAQSGKPVRYRDLLEASETAQEKIQQQGEAANAARDEARVLRAQVQSLTEMMTKLQPREPQRAASLADVGVRDPGREILEDPERFGQGAANLGARIATEQLTPQIQQLQQTITTLQGKSDLMDVRVAADQARAELAAEGIEVDSTTWTRLSPWLWAGAAGHPDGPKVSSSWKESYKGLRQAYPQQVQPRTTIPKEGIMRGNPAGSSRPTPVHATAPRTRVRGLVSALEAEAIRNGLDPKLAREAAERSEEKLQRKEARE